MKNKMKQKCKQFLAWILCLVLLLPHVAYAAPTAVTAIKEADISDDELKEALAQDAELYPDGGFEFFISQLEGTEGDSKLKLVVVRRGTTEKDASVDFKAVGVSAGYGEDYTITVKESALSERVLESEIGSDTLTEIYTEDTQVINGVPKEDETILEETEKVKVSASENKSSLQSARDTYLDTESSQLNWTQIDEAEQKEAEKVTEQGKQALEDFARDIPGTSYTFHFASGEYKKELYIDIIDDDISETDEQVMFLLSNANNGELAGTTNAYLNIKDNDENEKVIFAMATDKVVAERSEKVAKVTVKRVSGIEKMASVIVGTGADTACPEVDYTPVQTEVIFAQGITEQTVEIPLLENANAEKEVSFNIALDPESAFVQEGAAITTVVIKTEQQKIRDTALEDDELQAAAATAWTDSRSVSGYAGVSGSANTWSGRKRVLSDLDLSLADSISVTWKSDEGSYSEAYTYKDGCSEKTGYHNCTDRDTYLYVNGHTAKMYDNGKFSQKTETITLTDAMKTTGAYIDLEVRTQNNNRTAVARVSQIVINYPGYQFTITNTPYTSGTGSMNNIYSNQYTEKIYTESGDKTDSAGHRYKEGTTFTLATAQFAKNGSASYSDSVVLHRSSDTISVKHTYNKNKNSNGVAVKAGYDGNVYLAGYQLQKRESGSTWSGLIKPDNLVLSKSFVNTYKDYLLAGNEFKVRPVYRPYAANVMFQNTNPEKGSYGNGIKNDEVIRCTQLDTFEIKGIAAKGFSVDSFNLGAHGDGHLRKKGNSLNVLAEKGNAYHSHNANTIKSESKRVSAKAYTKVAVQNAKWIKTLSNVITFTPDKEFVYINMAYAVPKITLKIDPKSSNQDKGVVIYTPENEEVTEGSIQEGSYKQPLVVSGVMLNQEYTFNAVTQDGYKAYWKNFTGDENGDGVITTAEEKVVSQYDFVRIASNGNAYSFRPELPDSLIYYGFNVAQENRYAGYIDGVVALKTKPVFGKEEKIIPINGVQVSVSGITTTTKTDVDFGGLEETGGDGYFSISDRDFAPGDNVTVNLTYNSLQLSAAQAVNAAAIYYLDSYDTIQVDGAKMFTVDSKGNTKETDPASVSNGDRTYRIAIDTSSTNDALAARKAVFRFYRKDGSYMDGKDLTAISDNGSFTVDFNPATLQIPTGAYMTVQFSDQNDKVYFEHEMGFNYAQALGFLSFLSSFNFGGAEKAVELIGVIDSAFNFGWDGDMDEKSDVVSNSEDGKTKTISLGFSFEYNTEIESADETAQQKQGAVEDAAKNAGTSTTQKETQKEAAEAAVDSNPDTPNKSSAEMGAEVSFGMSFALGITMAKSEVPEHKGEWYFKDMMLCAKVEGGVDVSISYTTPIGIPILVGVSVGGSGSATFIVEQNYDKEEYYFSDVMDKDAAKIDIFDFNMSQGDRAFDAYGIFNISPYLDLSAGAGFDFLNLMVGGRADFNMNFFTDSGVENYGTVNLSAYIKLKILFIEKKFDIVSKDYNMFGNASGKASLTEEDYRYESLSSMNVVERSYLKGRKEWNSGNDLTAQSIASTSGIAETVLQNNINPNPDSNIVDLGNGKYLLVFVDDVPERQAWNSTAVFYSVYNGLEWSQPKIIEDDETMDKSPSVFDLGNMGVYVAWSTSSQKFVTEPGVIEALNSMDIHGALFNKELMCFEDIEEITKTSPYSYNDGIGDVEDNTADVEPHISYNELSNRMLIFYTKSEYSSSASDEDGLIGDAVNPYSVIAYRVYDFNREQWEDTYTADEGMDEDYTKAWYGQRFIELSPTVVINETLDEEGYWEEEPTITEYVPTTYEGEDDIIYEQDPIVIETDSITYNGLALFTYVMDYDGNKETETDRDIFMQIYIYDEDRFTHPIMLTSDKKAESELHLIHGCYATILAYISDGEIVAQNIGRIIRDGLMRTTVGGQTIYYVDRAREDAESSETEYAYIPTVTVVGNKTDYVPDDVNEDIEIELEEEKTEEIVRISNFDIAASEDYIYVIWPENKSVVKEGIDPTSEDALKGENRLAESQLYTVRFDINNAIITEPVQVTDESGANYDSIDFVVGNGEVGAVKAIATKAESITEEITDDEGNTISYPTADLNNKDFVVLDFTPTSTVTVEETSIEELTAGTDSVVNISFYNDGVETMEEMTFTAVSASGETIYTEKIGTEDSSTGRIFGGGHFDVSFPITLTEDAVGCSFTFNLKDTNGNVIAEGKYEEEIPLVLDVTDLEAHLTDRETAKFIVGIKNNSRRKSGIQKVEVKQKGFNEDGSDDKTLFTIETSSILPGESAYYEKEYVFGDYENMFYTSMTEDGSLEAKTEFVASAAGGEKKLTDITLLATAEQRLRMAAIKDIKLLDNSYNFSLKEGEVTKVETAIDSIPYVGSRYAGMDDEVYNSNGASGLRVLYKTDNTDIIELYDNGYMKALKAGQATIKAYIMPANNKVSYDDVDGTVQEDNFMSIPKEAITVREIAVTVSGKGTDTPVNIEATGVTLNSSNTSVAVGKTVVLQAAIAPLNATNKTITWKSSNPKIATVTNGVVKGVKAGKVTITATTSNGKTATCKVTVNGVKFTSSKVAMGVKETYKTLPKLSVGSTDKIKKVTYRTSNKKIASVKKVSNGAVKITAKKKGNAKITVTTSSGAKAVLKVTVKKAPKSIKAKKKEITLKKGKKTTLKYSLSKNSASATIKWKSSSKKVATVSSKGVVKAKKKGVTKITMTTYNKRKATVIVTVK